MSPAMAGADLSGITLRIGQQTLPLPGAHGPALSAAIAAQNQAARIPDVPDTLNPGIIDPAKAERFVAALPAQPADTLARMAGHEIVLNGQALGIGAAEPTRADAFAAPFTVVLGDTHGRRLDASSSVPVDVALAKARAAEAETALHAAETAVREAEAAHVGGNRLGEVRQRRAALASAWRLNAAAWAGAEPNDPAAKTTLTRATQAFREYRMPSGAPI